MNILDQAKDTAKELKISERDALTLEFLHRQTLASLAKNAKAEALFHFAASHSSGKIDGKTMRSCLNLIK